jgi:nicotinate-nucleotide--dimethylbenzimidazole phosphoribosyltransferase
MVEFDVVSPPDESVRQAAVARHARLTKPEGALGLLEELGAWLCACQGQCPPRPLARPRVVVFAGDHGVAAKGVSAYPSEVTAQMVANFQAGGAAINVLAGIAGATVRVVDISVAADTSAGDRKVRRSSGAIDTEDALTQDEVEAALAAGRAIADEEVDAGADLLVAGDMGIGNTTPAAVLVAALTGTEPVAVVGRGTGIDDNTWMRKTAAIRDALRRAKPVTADPVALLRTVAGADITAMAAFLAQAAIRRTPVVLDGLVSGAAALLAEELAPGARAWWVAGHRSTEPAHTIVLEQLDMAPLLELNMRLGEGTGATAAIPLLTMSVQVLTDMATFTDAGISGPATTGTEGAGGEEAAEPDAAARDAGAGLAAEATRPETAASDEAVGKPGTAERGAAGPEAESGRGAALPETERTGVPAEPRTGERGATAPQPETTEPGLGTLQQAAGPLAPERGPAAGSAAAGSAAAGGSATGDAAGAQPPTERGADAAKPETTEPGSATLRQAAEPLTPERSSAAGSATAGVQPPVERGADVADVVKPEFSDTDNTRPSTS